MTNEASVSSAPVTARRHAGACRSGAIANPIGTNRALANSPVPAASGAPAPPPRTLSAANWAVPDHTTADITTAGTEPMTGSASSPNVIPIASVGKKSGTDARSPNRAPVAFPPATATSGLSRTRIRGDYWLVAAAAFVASAPVPSSGRGSTSSGVLV